MTLRIYDSTNITVVENLWSDQPSKSIDLPKPIEIITETIQE